MKVHFLGLLLALILLIMPTLSLADVVYTYGFSPRGIGMGNAMVASSDDWASPYYNPAGNAFQTRPTVAAGYFYTNSVINAIGVEDDMLPLDAASGTLVGAVLPLPFESEFLHNRISIGVAGFMPTGMLIKMGVAEPTEPNFILLQNASRSSVMIPSVGVRITDGFALGAGIQAFMDTKGVINAYIDPSGAVQTQVGQELVTTFYPIYSTQFRPGEHWDAMKGWRFGFIYRAECYTAYRLPIVAALGDIPFIIEFDAVSLFIPNIYQFGVSYNYKRWLWEFDISYNEWSRFPDPHLIIHPNVNIPLVPIDFQESMTRDPKFHDTVTPRFGTEYMAYANEDVELFFRGGYSLDPSPVPPQRGYTNQIDTDRHMVGVSSGVKWTGVGDLRFTAPIIIDVCAQTQYLKRRVFHKDVGTELSNPGYPKIGVEGWLYAFGLTISTNFDYD